MATQSLVITLAYITQWADWYANRELVWSLALKLNIFLQ